MHRLEAALSPDALPGAPQNSRCLIRLPDLVAYCNRKHRFQMHRLEAALNMDALLGSARDYFERVTREYHAAKGPGGGPCQRRDVEARIAQY